MRRAGAGLALLYVVVALVTNQLSSRPVLPLFDGFAPPTPYNWVDPRPERAGDNVVPQPIERELPLTAAGVPASNASTDDGQAIVGLDEGSVPASPPDTAVLVRLAPTDAGTLGPLPPGLRAVSNAYKVELRYLPSQTPVTRLAERGTVALTAAETGDRMLYSPDGQGWEERTFRPYGTDHGVFTEVEAVGGWFVVASSVRPPSADGDDGGPSLRGVLLVVLGLAPIIGAVLVVRLPSPVPAAPAARRGPSRPRSGGKKGPKRRR